MHSVIKHMVDTWQLAPAVSDPQAPQGPQIAQAPQQPAQQVQYMWKLNWSHFKPKFSGNQKMMQRHIYLEKVIG